MDHWPMRCNHELCTLNSIDACSRVTNNIQHRHLSLPLSLSLFRTFFPRFLYQCLFTKIDPTCVYINVVAFEAQPEPSCFLLPLLKGFPYSGQFLSPLYSVYFFSSSFTQVQTISLFCFNIFSHSPYLSLSFLYLSLSLSLTQIRKKCLFANFCKDVSFT